MENPFCPKCNSFFFPAPSILNQMIAAWAAMWVMLLTPRGEWLPRRRAWTRTDSDLPWLPGVDRGGSMTPSQPARKTSLSHWEPLRRHSRPNQLLSDGNPRPQTSCKQSRETRNTLLMAKLLKPGMLFNFIPLGGAVSLILAAVWGSFNDLLWLKNVTLFLNVQQSLKGLQHQLQMHYLSRNLRK